MNALVLLNNSQTFIGTLTTIVVLCVISEGNFIHKILESLRKATDTNIQSLKTKLSHPNLLDSLDYQEFISHSETLNEESEQTEYYVIISGINAWLNANNSGIMANAFSNAQKVIEKAHESLEQFLSPHYCFLYCLILFICDELVCFSESEVVLELVNIFLVLFITYSFVLLLAVWMRYINRFGLLKKSGIPNHLDLASGLIHFNNGKAITTIVWLVLILIYFHYGRIHIINISPECFCWMIIVALDAIIFIFPFLYIYIRHENDGLPKHTNLTYNFTFTHFFYGTLICMFVCWIIYCFGLTMNPDFFFISSGVYIKWGSIVFIVLFGLVMPSCLPYAVFYRAEKNTLRLINQANPGNIEDAFLERIREFNNRHSRENG